MKRILITGHEGFVGRHLLSHYNRPGFEVVGVDSASSNTDWMELFRRGPNLQFDAVFHCAAFVGGRRGIDGSPAYLHTYNTMLDAALFTWALDAKPGRIVYFSSSAAYPMWAQDMNVDRDWFCPMREDYINFDDLMLPETSYGLSKLHGEQMAASVRSVVPVTILRPFSGYGEDQSLDYPFPAFIQRAIKHQDPFEVWGSGQQQRDWVHIDDLVGAAAAAVEGGVDGPVNVCTGIGTTFDTLAEMCMSAAGYRAPIEHQNVGPAGGVDYRVGNPTKLHEFYTPGVSLDEGVLRAVRV